MKLSTIAIWIFVAPVLFVATAVLAIMAAWRDARKALGV